MDHVKFPIATVGYVWNDGDFELDGNKYRYHAKVGAKHNGIDSSKVIHLFLYRGNDVLYAYNHKEFDQKDKAAKKALEYVLNLYR